MSISFPTASQNQGVFNTYNEMCVLVIARTSPRLHLEKKLIFSSALSNHKQPIGWHWRAFQTQRLAGWIVAEENTKNLKPLFVFQPAPLRKVSSRLQVWTVWAAAHADEEKGGESDAINLWPQRREREGWSRIELRILDSRVPQKASIRARTASALISTDASLGCRERRLCWLWQLPSPQQHQRKSSQTQRGDLLPRGFWRQAVCELIERAVLIKDPAGPWAHARACSYIPTPLSTQFTQFCSWSLSSFYFMVSVFKGLSFVLWKAARLSRPFVEWTYCWNCLLYWNTG